MRRIFRLSSILVLFLALIGTAHASTLSAPPNNLGLIGYWTMDGKTINWSTGQETDSSGNGNTGSLINMSTTTSPVLGKLGQALSFNGSSQYIKSTTSPSSPTALSVSFWMNAADLHNYGVIADQWDETSNARSWAIALFGDGHIYAYNSDTGLNGPQISSNKVIAINTWYFITVVEDPSNPTTGKRIYVNGVLDNSGAESAIYTVAIPIPIAYSPKFAGSANYFKGTLDDVRIYNRALSAADVAKLYNAGAAKQNVSQATLIPNGLVGYWTMDGKTTNWSTNQELDSSGNGNTGTLVNMSQTTSPVLGKIGQALYLNGINQYISTGQQILPNTPSAFTMSAWVNIKSFGAGIIMAENTSAPYFTGGILTHTAGGNKFYFSVDGFGSSAYSNSTPTNGTWYHVVGVYDSTSATQKEVLYVNGVLQTVTANATAFGLSGNTVTIGARYSDILFNGSIEDARIYNRALSAQEVQELYAAGAGTKIDVTQPNKFAQGGLVGYWTMDGKTTNWSTNQELDSSGNGNTGTMVNMSKTASPVLGKIGQALMFSGSASNYVQAGGLVSLGTSNQPYTLTAWVKPAAASASGDIIHVSAASDGTGWCLGSMNLSAGVARTVSWTGGLSLVTGVTSLAANKWYHLVATWNASGGLTLYVNGSVDGNTPQATYAASGASDYVTMGSTASGGGCGGSTGSFNGAIDDVRVYNRALSAQEVKALYNQGK